MSMVKLGFYTFEVAIFFICQMAALASETIIGIATVIVDSPRDMLAYMDMIASKVLLAVLSALGCRIWPKYNMQSVIDAGYNMKTRPKRR